MAVELGTFDADEAHPAVDDDTAAAAHPCAVYHDRVERHERMYVVRMYVVLLRGQGAELHHHGRADGDHAVGLPVTAQLIERLGDKTLATIGAVVGDDDGIGVDALHAG